MVRYLKKRRGCVEHGAWGSAKLLAVIAVTALAMGVTGCGDGNDSPPTTSNSTPSGEESNDSDGEKEEAKKPRRLVEIKYSASDVKRNPFVPDPELFPEKFGEEQKDLVEKKGGPKLKGTLHKHPVSAFELSAVISQVPVPKGMFVGPNGKGFVLIKGDEIGKSGAVIEQIRDEAVVVGFPESDEKKTIELRTVRKDKKGKKALGKDELSKDEKEFLRQLQERESKQSGGDQDG